MNIQGPDDLLSKINSLQSKKVNPSLSKEADSGFGDILKEAFNDVNNLQGQVKNSVEKLLSGETKDVDEVMNKVAEAGVAFDLMIEVKDKVIDAYKQLERM